MGSADDRQLEEEAASVPDALGDPVLAELWDNDTDAEYDHLADTVSHPRARRVGG